MKRTHSWSHGILLVMVGLATGIFGIVFALMIPMRGIANWWLAIIGGVIVIGGVILASRAKIDRSVPANEKRLPSARLHRSPRR